MCQIWDTGKFISIDVKDFYPSGYHRDLVSVTGEYHDGMHTESFKGLVRRCLYRQYLSPTGTFKDAVRASKGSGIGSGTTLHHLCLKEIEIGCSEIWKELFPEGRRMQFIMFSERYRKGLKNLVSMLGPTAN